MSQTHTNNCFVNNRHYLVQIFKKGFKIAISWYWKVQIWPIIIEEIWAIHFSLKSPGLKFASCKTKILIVKKIKKMSISSEITRDGRLSRENVGIPVPVPKILGTGTQSHRTVGIGSKICGSVPVLKSRATMPGDNEWIFKLGFN